MIIILVGHAVNYGVIGSEKNNRDPNNNFNSSTVYKLNFIVKLFFV